MPIQQQRFLGCSVSNLHASAGFNEQPSTLEVIVVPDPLLDEEFENPIMGQFVEFELTDENERTWSFNGIVQSYVQEESFSSHPAYRVTVTDPRELLGGVQLIIGDYAGPVDVPNLVNCYGYLENQSFGSAQVNDAGMPWNLIKRAYNELTPIGFAGNDYGGPLLFRGQSIEVDLSLLPSMPDSYRIGGGSVSLLDAIAQVCRDSSYDFIVTMVRSVLGPVVQIRTVGRRFQPGLTAIANFLNANPEAVVASRGLELRNEPTSFFLSGGYKTDLIVVSQSGSTPETATIWPFWGFDNNGNVNIGRSINASGQIDMNMASGIPSYHSFNANFLPFKTESRSISDNLFNYFGSGNTTIPIYAADLRAAIKGQDEWESMLESYDSLNLFDFEGNFALNAINTILRANNGAGGGVKPHQLRNTQAARMGDLSTQLERKRDAEIHLFEFYSMWANQFMGKKFMVRIPHNILATRDQTSLQYKLNIEPADGAYLPEGAEPLGLPNASRDLFTTDDDRFVCFARFDNAQNIDYSALNPNDYSITADTGILFVKCTIDTLPPFGFLDWTTCSSPRVIINMPGVVGFKDTNQPSRISDLFIELQNAQYRRDGQPLITPEEEEFIREQMNIIVNMPGGNNVIGEIGKVPAVPNSVAVPLRSNTETYGPWSITGAQGKVYFEHDDSLTPWNYGGFDSMNAAANAKIQEAVSAMQASEVGQITIPGIPAVDLGTELIGDGPIVTAIDIGFDTDGITTSYRMRTYTPKYGLFAKHNADKLLNFSRLSQQQRRQNRQLIRETTGKFAVGAGATNEERQLFADMRTRRDFASRSPHEVIFAQTVGVIPSGSEEPMYQHTVALDTVGSTMPRLQSTLSQAAVGLDSIFTPYTNRRSFDSIPTLQGRYPDTITNDNPEITTPAKYPLAGTNGEDIIPYGMGMCTKITVYDYILMPVHNLSRSSPFDTENTTYPSGRLPDGSLLFRRSTPDGELQDFAVNEQLYELSEDADTFDGYTPRVEYAGIALKVPMILSGWGYDMQGYPVPNANGFGGAIQSSSANQIDRSQEFDENFQTDMSKWKTGPLDLRWDESAGLWRVGTPQYPPLMLGQIIDSTSAEINPELITSLAGLSAGSFPEGHALPNPTTPSSNSSSSSRLVEWINPLNILCGTDSVVLLSWSGKGIKYIVVNVYQEVRTIEVNTDIRLEDGNIQFNTVTIPYTASPQAGN